MRQSRLGQRRARGRRVAVGDEDAPGQEAERAFERAHVAVRDEDGEAKLLEQRLDAGDQHDVIGAKKFDHAASSPLNDQLREEAWRHPARKGLVDELKILGSGPKSPRPAAESFALGVVLSIEENAPERGLEPLVALVRPDMERVNQTILSRSASDVSMIPEVANHLISSGGKRLRPMLTLAAAGLCGYRGAGHVKLAAAVEFMHTATLLHDDVVDESDMRRGKLAARMLWGNEASVLVGDFLLGQAFKMMVEVGSLPCLEVLAAAAAVIAEGEVMQLSAAKDTETSEDDYLEVIRAKTAALFGAAAEVGPLLAERPKAEIAACRGYGVNLGVAFQLIDDALDYGGAAAKLGKNVGDDFREGKITLPIVLSFRRGAQAERDFWKRTLERGEIEDGDLDTAISLLHKHRALEDTIERARHYGAMARDALELFPTSPWKSALSEAVDFCVERAY